MIIRKVDATNDWTFGKGLSNYAKDEEAINQNIKSRLLSWLGDCFFAPDEGVDWRGRLDVGQQEALQQELKAVILQSSGVVGVANVSAVFDSSSRFIRITYNVETIFGNAFQSAVDQTVI